MKRAHPRSRGENVHGVRTIEFDRGSSPLTRGKLVVLQIAEGERGLIPAHAGKTSAVARLSSSSRAHPRSRGENPVFLEIPGKGTGSSPLTRGKRRGRGRGSRRSGLIPAHAGKTVAAYTGDTGTGLIPAHAGKTDFPDHDQGRWGAHPRSRGENTDLHSISGGPEGSSPLTRGKRPLQNGLRRPLGLIPAHAGKTPSTSRATACVMGSSPLTRGKLHPKTGKPMDDGLIPAHAGKTSLLRTVTHQVWAHPRSRGEN